jgi:hypothetical protein
MRRRKGQEQRQRLSSRSTILGVHRARMDHLRSLGR